MIKTNVEGASKDVKNIYIRVNDKSKRVTKVYKNVNGLSVPVYQKESVSELNCGEINSTLKTTLYDAYKNLGEVRDMVYYNGQYIALCRRGDTCNIYYSTNLTSWSKKQISSSGGKNLLYIKLLNDKVFVVCTVSTLWISGNVSGTWSSKTLSSGNTLDFAFDYFLGKYVLLQQKYFYTSLDMSTMTKITKTNTSYTPYISLVLGNKLYVSNGTTSMYYFDETTTLTPKSVTGCDSRYAYDIAKIDDTHLMISGGESSGATDKYLINYDTENKTFEDIYINGKYDPNLKLMFQRIIPFNNDYILFGYQTISSVKYPYFAYYDTEKSVLKKLDLINYSLGIPTSYRSHSLFVYDNKLVIALNGNTSNTDMGNIQVCEVLNV